MSATPPPRPDPFPSAQARSQIAAAVQRGCNCSVVVVWIGEKESVATAAIQEGVDLSTIPALIRAVADTPFPDPKESMKVA